MESHSDVTWQDSNWYNVEVCGRKNTQGGGREREREREGERERERKRDREYESINYHIAVLSLIKYL